MQPEQFPGTQRCSRSSCALCFFHVLDSRSTRVIEENNRIPLLLLGMFLGFRIQGLWVHVGCFFCGVCSVDCCQQT